MIKFDTARFGALETDEDKVITFPDGIVGLPDLKRFILIDHKETPVKWLQSVEDPDMAFIVASPDVVSADYSINPDRNTVEILGLENNDDLVVLLIIRVSGDEVIANLQGPLLMNAKNKKGVQVVLDNPRKYK